MPGRTLNLSLEDCIGEPFRLVRWTTEHARDVYPVLDEQGAVVGFWRKGAAYFDGHHGQRVNVSNKGLITHRLDAADAIILDTHPEYDPGWPTEG